MHSLLRKPLLGFTILLLFQWVGEALVAWAGVPVPGAVLGMLLLFMALLAWGKAPGSVQAASQTLLGNLAMLFVPAAVGALLRMAEYKQYGWAFLLTIGLSTLATLAVVAWWFERTDSCKH